MKKIKLTKEQAESLRTYKETPDTETGKRLNDLEYFIDMRHTFVNEMACLKDFTIEEFARLLYVRNSYEVEQEYKVGDWVRSEMTATVGKIVRVGKDFVELDNGEVPSSYYVRHATPEEIKAEQERRVWAKIGREVGEFHDGDIGMGRDGYTWEKIGNLKRVYKSGNMKGFYPAESFISFKEDGSNGT